jgi:hypothetical protein
LQDREVVLSRRVPFNPSPATSVMKEIKTEILPGFKCDTIPTERVPVEMKVSIA